VPNPSSGNQHLLQRAYQRYDAQVVGLTESVRAWRDRGRFLPIAGHSVFVIDAGPREAGRALLLLHGFPTSSHDFHRVLPALSAEQRVILLDLPGFGLSDKPIDYSYSLLEQAEIVAMLLRHLSVHRCQIVAHDMGTSVACELLARRERGLLPFEIESLVLMNGSVHIELAQLTPSQRLLRTRLAPLLIKAGSRSLFGMQMGRIVGLPLLDADLDDMWCLLEHKDGTRRLPQIIHYLDERTRFWHRWIGALTRLELPTLVLWGPRDSVAVTAIGERLAQEIRSARFERLEGLGHYPQLEAPERTAAALLAFLSEPGPRRPMASQPALLR
jgi:pimeloyl-ACP methyl ester carboxylesterase